ncbi:TPA: ShET2/EspL2 family type III secretion system effector toxin [Escherichia coli]|uniref:ShET2/EspL2 family type III secretion system effector toxin n=13 Tax=Escherichia coli TaxID=562 RepID=A0A244BI02_ECOLX|nr:ShET2/EspL2 family type III secretion system effector toxin [Escherichia coli]EKJ6346241.1 ShET2/EspL2 family type III secretion system effector toxin [Escherichia coli]EKJ6369191.1 ShET2/EspL2 family type III secretion system effector toxin [Escherichia coli]MBM2970993.1 ShET2/EspL2 family type III secretion system effector toxin [Escherichia coli]MBT9226913.1 ShET2/EspL2 family type III secretion system effector toxin [Escherichia coli]MCO4944359.1 ShET2/EspL2 family type III secretion sy
MVDNVTVGSVCAQSPSFMPELDGGKNKTQLIVDDIVAYLKNPSVYSFEKEGPLNHFFNNCSEIEPWVLIGGGLIIIVSTSEQDPESLIVTVGDIEGKYATQIPVPPALTTSLKDIFIRPHTNADDESFTKEQKKANSKYDIVDYNCKVYFNEKPEDLVVCRHISLQYCIDSMNENTGKVPLKECYSTPEGIQQHFPYELDQQFDNLINNPPPGTCVVASDKFGEILSVFFHRMEKEKLTHMAAIVKSQKHAMAVRLRIKQTPAGETEYVVSFYDPNATNTAVRYKAKNCDSFGSLQSFINIELANIKWVKTEICSECVGIIPYLPREQAHLLSGIDNELQPPLSPSALYLLMQMGTYENIVLFFDKLRNSQEMTVSKVLEILAAKGPGGTYGLCMSLQHDNLNKINEYITNLKELARKFNFSREDLETLLLAKDNRGVSAISVALSKNKKESVKVLFLAIDDFEKEFGVNKNEILRSVGKEIDSIYDLNSAIRTNDYNVVNILLANIKAKMFKNEINKEDILKLMAAREKWTGESDKWTKASGLYSAIVKGYTEIVAAWMETADVIASHYENDKDVVRELLSLSRNNAVCSLHIASFKKMSKQVIDVYLSAAIRLALKHGFSFDEIVEQFTRDFDGKSFSHVVNNGNDIHMGLWLKILKIVVGENENYLKDVMMQLEEKNNEGKSVISQANGNPVLKELFWKAVDEFNFPQEELNRLKQYRSL